MSTIKHLEVGLKPQSVGLGIPVIVPPDWHRKVTFTNCVAFSGAILNGM